MEIFCMGSRYWLVAKTFFFRVWAWVRQTKADESSHRNLESNLLLHLSPDGFAHYDRQVNVTLQNCVQQWKGKVENKLKNTYPSSLSLSTSRKCLTVKMKLSDPLALKILAVPAQNRFHWFHD